MSYYAFIIDNEINGKGQCPCTADNLECIEISEEVYNNLEQYIWNGTEIILNPNYDNIVLEQAKADKIALNDSLRDTALLSGVTYQNVLFDSDDSQKINLLATYNRMSDNDKIMWFGMNNVPLECTKIDLFNIGDLITQLHTFCWTNNYEIKLKIDNAETLEDLEKIEINYNYFNS